MTLPKTYNAKDYEEDIYKLWEESGGFQPKKGHGEPFSIVLPPPNATGQLHLGHAVMLALEDTFVRFARMQGRETVWVPGTDHAAIATENVVIRKLQEEGIADPRQELGREKVLERIHEFVEESRGTIRNQVRKMGASVDWSRERYTMEPAMNNIVTKVFVKMYEDGLIYRGHRIVNWDPNLETTVSDDEVDHVEQKTPLYTFQYGPFKIATSRPETKFGDKYVVVHPDDERYKDYKHGQEFEAEWINGKITGVVIKDEVIDPEFGTGAMTITPWHDHTDFEIAQRHDLDVQQIIDFDGKLTEVAGDFKFIRISDARQKVVDRLKEKGLLLDVKEDYVHNIAVAARGGGIIEPQIMNQWFIDVNKPVVHWKGKKLSLKAVMRDVVESGDTRIIPERFNKIYYSWIDNLHDWCISRQIWWGHRIPAWYRDAEVYVGESAPDDGHDWNHDPDTLDTWFSSGMWTWSTLVDKELAEAGDLDLNKLLKKSPDFKDYHPTTVLETGYDIIFFWVARMVLMTTYVTGETPFKDVYLHGMVRTREGKKMSKSSPETTIDPLEIIPEYGADALRLSMLIGQTPGNDNKLYKEKIAGYRNFCNKLWNVGRFISEVVDDKAYRGKVSINTPADAWIYNRVQTVVVDATKALEEYRVSDVGQMIYQLLWDDFADWYIEASKIEPNHRLLVELYRTILKLTHPLAPFVTEALWKTVGDDSLLLTSSWPTPQKKVKEDLANDFIELQKIVTEIRELKNELQLTETHLYYKESDFLDQHCDLVVQLSNISSCKQVVDGYGIRLTKTDINCWVDVEENVTRTYLFKLVRKRDKQSKLLEQLNQKLKNKAYTQKAPKELVEETRQNAENTAVYIERLNEQIVNLEHLIKLYQ